MLFKILKQPAKIAIRLFCKKIIVNQPALLKSKGPLLIACNHPNSFLDAIILATAFDQPIISLARGDAFKNKMVFKILKSLNILPVYRLSEGAENLNSNYDTFAICRDIFKKNGIVLIFSEGLCVNEWKLRPLKKGTARLAFSSWEQGIDLTVLPAGINYHSFTSFGKIVRLNFEKPIRLSDMQPVTTTGHAINAFNDLLYSRMKQVVDHLDTDEEIKKQEKFALSSKLQQHPMLAIPALAGKWIHAPLFQPVQKWSWKNFKGRDHYDSVMIGLLFLLYPIYLTAFALVIQYFLGGYYWLLPFIIMPLLAWSFVKWKPSFNPKA